VKRRDFIGGTAATLLLSQAGLASGMGGEGNLIWRANGQNMRWAIQGFTGGSSGSMCTRSRHYSNVAFRYARFVLPTSYTADFPPITDTDWPTNLSYQVGVEYPFNNSFSGIPTRITVKFSGANSVNYVNTDHSGFIVSDIVDFGSTVPANTFFGLWTTVENTGATGTGGLPYQVTASDNYQAGYERYTGNVLSTSSLVSANTALTASSITPVGNTQSGVNTILTPCMMLIQCNSHAKSIVGVGDSIMYGVGEGNLGSNANGDSMGSALGNAGYSARWINEVLGYNFVNFGRGSDGFKYYTTATWKYRLQLLTLANPTHILCQNGHNDVMLSGGAPTILGFAQSCYAGIRAAVPGVPIIQACITPNSSSTDNWMTSGNQTATAGFGDSTSVRGIFNDTYVRTNNSALGNNGFIDPNPATEFGYTEGNVGSETSLLKVTGAANGYAQDGTHPNSFACATIANNVIAFLNGAQVIDPFT
jgi:lysophospholipase L1-like esterase